MDSSLPTIKDDSSFAFGIVKRKNADCITLFSRMVGEEKAVKIIHLYNTHNAGNSYEKSLADEIILNLIKVL